MEEKFIQQLKKTYIKQKTSDHEVFMSWENLKHRLPDQDKQKPFYQQNRYLFAGVALFLLIGAVGITQAASPNQPLYQMKVAMDNSVAKILGKPQITVDNGANDIIKAAKQQSPTQVHNAVDQYKKTVQESTDQANQETTEQKNSYKQNFTEQENKLKSIEPTSSQEKADVNNAITQTEKAKQEVKGASTSNINSENSNNNEDHSNGNSNANSHANQSNNGNNGKNK